MRFGRVEVTGGFLLLVAWLNYLDQQMVVPLALLACFCHELGHYIVIRALRHNITQVRLSVVGAEMVLDHSMGYWQEITAALAGPATNFLLAAITAQYSRSSLFVGLNLLLGMFNLLPVGELDGARALRCAISLLGGAEMAEIVSRRLNMVIAIVLLWGGTFLLGAGGNATLLIVAVWTIVSLFRRNWRKRACLNGWKRVK